MHRVLCHLSLVGDDYSAMMISDAVAALKLGEKNVKICRPVYVSSISSLFTLLITFDLLFPQFRFQPPLTPYSPTMLRVFNYVATPEEVYKYTSELWNLITQGTVNIKIFKEYPFTVEGIRQSHLDIVSRSTVGKLIVKVA